MNEIIFAKPQLDPVEYKNWGRSGCKVSVLREDLVHPYVSGNKWRKLKYNLIHIVNSGKKLVLTFGGAYSNHIVATAAAASAYGIESIGIIRGEKVDNDYLGFASSRGMRLYFVSRSEYREKKSDEFLNRILDNLYADNIINDKNDVFIIPEGGSNELAVKGAMEIMDEIPESTDIIACACGTGGTIAGISRALKNHQSAIGISVLKAEAYFENEMKQMGGNSEKIRFIYDYHFGGYAKKTTELTLFCEDFYASTGIPVEPVYTGKLFYAINDLLQKNYFPPGSEITVVHTGGIFRF